MPTNPIINPGEADAEVDSQQACIICFNANDPSGAGGLAADVTTVASVGAHALPVMSGAYSRDTGEIFDHFELSDEAVTEQARAILEDIPVQVFKVGFVGSPENLSAIAEISADYPNIPLVAYMPNLSWWEDVKIDSYQDAFRELLLPSNHCTYGQPQYPVAMAIARLGERSPTWCQGYRPRGERVRRRLHTGHRNTHARPTN